MVTEILAGFIVAPFLVRRLGVTGYGLWIVIGSLGGYFSFVDFGMRGSVGRQLAACRATGDWEEANRIINTALAILSALAVLVIVGVGLSSMVLDRMFEVPGDQIGNARLALLLVGANLALSFPLQIFDGNLWAAQRFDVLNLVDIPATLVRIGLTFAFVRNGNDIVTLALITLVTSAGSGVIKGAISFRMDRFLAISRRHIRRESGHVLFGYGWWNFVLALARLTKTQFSPLLIGSFLNVALVTPFSIARRLQDYAHKVIWTATGVLIPIATGFHARAEVAPQQRLFVEGGKYATAFATFFVVYFICLGRSVIGLWMGPQFSYAAALLIILTLGEYVQMTQSLTGSIILATARHKMLAWLAVVETVITLGSSSISRATFWLDRCLLRTGCPTSGVQWHRHCDSWVPSHWRRIRKVPTRGSSSSFHCGYYPRGGACRCHVLETAIQLGDIGCVFSRVRPHLCCLMLDDS